LEETGATLVLITHDAALAAACDRVIEMKDGQIVRDYPRAAIAAGAVGAGGGAVGAAAGAVGAAAGSVGAGVGAAGAAARAVAE
jgi:energy-coupling factor transporter ATP-binding protein EcfA2